MTCAGCHHEQVLKRDHDPSLDAFDMGTVVLREGDVVAGHVATTLSTMWSPGRPFTRQDWIWLVIVWANGDREAPIEDYPPWSIVKEIQDGALTWDDGDHRGTYSAEWLPADQSQATWAALGISPGDF